MTSRQPVHGLIFLFEYQGGNEQSDEETRQDCPDDLWFANQVRILVDTKGMPANVYLDNS